MYNREISVSIVIAIFMGTYLLGCANNNEQTIDILSGAYKHDNSSKNDFSPSPLSVKVGTKIIWINKDPATPHSVKTDTGNVFESPMMKFDQKYTFTFDKKGAYSYHCALHPWMRGYIEVK